MPDLFVSYAHNDDRPPGGAERGWVTTLVAELEKVLLRKLGGAGIWMDHQLAAGARIEKSLLDNVRSSRALLLVMSPSYHRSVWCQRELSNFLIPAATAKTFPQVFVVEMERVEPHDWPEPLRDLKTLRFYVPGDATQPEDKLLGWPVPNLDEDSPYWSRLNGLAHWIAQALNDPRPGQPVPQGPSVLVAEPTDDLIEEWYALCEALRQQGAEVLPRSAYPRDCRAAYANAFERDLKRAKLFAQLFGPRQGRRPPDSEESFTLLQARAAFNERQRRALRLLQ